MEGKVYTERYSESRLTRSYYIQREVHTRRVHRKGSHSLHKEHINGVEIHTEEVNMEGRYICRELHMEESCT